jgi:hypothetical protein
MTNVSLEFCYRYLYSADRLCGLVVRVLENTAVGIRHADHVAPSICKSWQSLRREAAVSRSV